MEFSGGVQGIEHLGPVVDQRDLQDFQPLFERISRKRVVRGDQLLGQAPAQLTPLLGLFLVAITLFLRMLDLLVHRVEQ
ncbi:hypothetical protein JTM20_40415, partial [Pseudomonas aeruginosa]|nr:hypothetical protein [Pseudomonas aeruginosa]